MREIRTQDAVGHALCHDITQIIKGVTKDARFRKGHVVTAEDIPVLLSLGKENLYVWEAGEGMLHEDEAAELLYEICAGGQANMLPSEVKEGKIEVRAACDGLLTVDVERLRRVNSLGEMMIATRAGNFPVKKGDALAGTRVIPLAIHRDKMEQARAVAEGRPLLWLHPFKKLRAGLVICGSEVYNGLTPDTFSDVIREKLAEYGSEVGLHTILPDDHERITAEILRMIADGAEMVLCTGGMSVDPDDRTPLAIKNTGPEMVSYGAPVLPGAMFLLAYYHGIPIVGLPGCVMYSARTAFDLMLPRLLAGLRVSADDLAALGHGGLCLGCKPCTFPNCGFGKGA